MGISPWLSSSRWLGAGLLASVLAPGCCCDMGPDRLVGVEVTDERGGFREEIAFDDSVNDFPLNAFLQAYRVGSPGPGKLTTIPMFELYDADGRELSLARFTAVNDGGCAFAPAPAREGWATAAAPRAASSVSLRHLTESARSPRRFARWSPPPTRSVQVELAARPARGASAAWVELVA